MPATTTSLLDLQPTFALRPAGPADALTLSRLATLDEAPALVGDVLIGERDGTAVAAVAVASGDVVADPFVASEELVGLLRARAAHLRGSAHPALRRFLHNLGRGERHTAAWIG